MNRIEQQQRKIVVLMNLTLDGTLQAPGRPDEDLRGDFQYGGWAVPYMAMQSKEALEAMPETGPLLMGRRTYEAMYDFWPKQTGSPFTELLNNTQKYVASTSLQEPLPWINSTLLQGDAASAVARLKAQPGKNFLVMGSGELVQTLIKHNLINLYILLIHPLVLGTGRRLFPEGVPCASLHLIDAKKTSNGVAVLTYQPVDSEPGKERA